MTRAVPPNKVVIVGGNHFNILGVVRSFGRMGIRPYGVLTGAARKYVTRSRYWQEVYPVQDDALIEPLFEKFLNETHKPVVIPCLDKQAAQVDLNYDRLKERFILPSINGAQGEIVKAMDKLRQYELAQAHNVDMAPTLVVDLPQDATLAPDFKPPYILKPVMTIEGEKLDIEICRDLDAYRNAISKFTRLEYPRILVQRYLAERREFCISGAVMPSGGFDMAVVENIRRWPQGFGIGSFAQLSLEPEVTAYARRLMAFARDVGYVGPIDIEFFRSLEDGAFYLNEVNWRSSGRNFISFHTGVHPAYDYYMDAVGASRHTFERVNTRPGYVFSGRGEFHLAFHDRTTPVRTWLRDMARANSYSTWYWRDPVPFFSETTRLLGSMFNLVSARLFKRFSPKSKNKGRSDAD